MLQLQIDHNPTPGTAFLAFNPQIPIIAARAAVEVERYRRNKSSTTNYLEQLSSALAGQKNLKASLEGKKLSDPFGATVLVNAYRSSQEGEPGESRSAAIKEAIEWFTSELHKFSDNKESLSDESLVNIRKFCVSLSDFSASSRKVITGEQSKASHRKVR